MAVFNPIQTNQRPLREKLVERLWEIARVLLCNATPFFMRRWRRCVTAAFSRFGSGRCELAKSISLSRTCRVDYPWNLSIGDKSSIGERAWVYALDKIVIGSNCCIGNNVSLITGSHDISSPYFNLVTKPITIGDNVWVATNAMILPGVTIGDGAVVAAGSVVAKNIEPWTVVGGNPAKFIKKRELKDD